MTMKNMRKAVIVTFTNPDVPGVQIRCKAEYETSWRPSEIAVSISSTWRNGLRAAVGSDQYSNWKTVDQTEIIMGRSTDETLATDCEICLGSGTTPQYQSSCPWCNGSGQKL